MPYPRRLLNDHETVALDLHPHWWYFAKAVVALVAAVVLGIVAINLDDIQFRTGAHLAALALVVASTVWLAVRYSRWATMNFVVTSDRVIFRSGVIAKNGIEIPLDRVNNVIFSQSIIERLLGAGDLLIESGGETGQQRFTDVRNPDQVQKLIHAQKRMLEERRYAGSTAATGRGLDVVTQLEKLEGLLERGMLSRDEFDQQKRQLLGS